MPQRTLFNGTTMHSSTRTARHRNAVHFPKCDQLKRFRTFKDGSLLSGIQRALLDWLLRNSCLCQL
jgi:hypothetical protein